LGSSTRRAATTSPAVPPPTTMKSYAEDRDGEVVEVSTLGRRVKDHDCGKPGPNNCKLEVLSISMM
jgi:hypothetical protein